VKSLDIKLIKNLIFGELTMNKQINKFCNSIQFAGVIFSGLLIGLPAISQTAQAQQKSVNVPASQVNPCPRIFYEEPHNNRVRVPQGCPPNAFTNRKNTQGTSSGSSSNQTQLGVGGEAPDSNVDSQSSTSQTTVVPAPQPLNSPNQSIPSSQINPNTGSRINGSAGGYTQRWQTQQNSRDNSRLSTSNRYENAVAAVSPTDGRVSVLLVNQTNAPIVYQAIGDTQQRILPGRSQITLQGLNTPANVAFYRQDRGLLMVTPRSYAQGTLEVTLQETTDFAMDRTALRIENNGAVYLN
jgi:hypothetical protein